MTHDWHIHPDDQIAEVRFSGEIGPSEIVEAVMSLTDQVGWQSDFSILYYFQHDTSLSEVTFAALEDLLPKMLKRGAEVRKGRGGATPRSAILYTNPVLQSILELWVLSNKNNELVEFKLFMSREKAIAWLKSGAPE